MKNLKSKLKHSAMTFYADETSYRIMSARLVIKLPSGENIVIKCQSHIPEVEKFKNCFRDFGKYSGFYAAKIDCEIGFRHSYNQVLNAKECLAFMAWLNKESENKNLFYKFPDCEISQIIEVLQSLGAEFSEVVVNKTTFINWKRNQKAEEDLVNEITSKTC
jgi:hypothetical protein